MHDRLRHLTRLRARRGASHALLAALVGVAAAALLAAGVVARWRVRAAAERRTFAGSEACARCHREEAAGWERSQHAVAMQPATPRTVLARFDSMPILDGEATFRFIRRGDRFFVRTDGMDGRPHDYEIRYTFGVFPLQQYLVPLPGGRLQALALAWDARPDSLGGQRWFSLNAGRRVAPGDDEHWTGRLYNWNFRCADCHSTAVRKQYRADSAVFRTAYSEISVGCEACHGPGAAHARWFRTWRPLRWGRPAAAALPARLTERRDARWTLPPGARTAQRNGPPRADREIETCAQCHARRIHVADGYTAGAPLLDYYIPALLESDLYHADGQQQEEVYNYGSFLQSRMYAAGVTCADCHEPHSAKLRAPGPQVCARCHVPAAYDSASHHRHSARSGATCVTCHMPTATYMQVDPRHDHGMRVPRPDLSAAIGVPNACTQCHGDRDARWADAAVRAWYGRPALSYQRFARAFATDDRDAPGAADSLARVAHDSAESVIARASALARLASRPGPIALAAATSYLDDPHPLLRLAALQVMDAFPAGQRVPLVMPRLRDRLRAIRQGAAWTLASSAGRLPSSARDAFARAASEFVRSQRYNADQPDHRVTLGAFYWQLGRPDSAEAEYRAAIALAPRFAQPYVDLSALLASTGRPGDAEVVLRTAVARLPDDAGMHYALGQHLRQSGRDAEALAAFRRAARLRPDVPEFTRAARTGSR